MDAAVIAAYGWNASADNDEALPGRCNQFLVWTERGETGRGAWEARHRDDPRLPRCEILCAACYAKATGRVPMAENHLPQ